MRNAFPITLAVAGCSLVAPLSTNLAQGTAFTYWGRLNDGSSPAQGLYDLSFTVFDSSAGGTNVGGVVTNSAVPVTNGLFTVALDFGAVLLRFVWSCH